ncbi:MAG: hypothetical protein AAB618_02635 [Patescibacteria group bacterium]
MSQIRGGEICPRSKTFFQTRECTVWFLWLATVLIGALAVAVTLFVVSHSQYALYEATHENFFTFMVEVLPFLWIVIFGLMVLVGVYEVRHTKRGYRYPLWQIVGSSLILSLAGGAALQLFGLGYTTDHVLGEHMGIYSSQEKIERRMWQNPEEGRMLGKQVRPLMPPALVVDFVDIAGKSWAVDVSELTPLELELLDSEENVRLIGVLTDKENSFFHSCGAFPWQLDKAVTRADLSAARKVFETRVHGYGEQAEHALLKVTGKEDSDDDDKSPCSRIEPVRRFEAQ